MLKWLTLLIGIAFAQTAQAQSYLLFSTQAACLARSQAMCTAMGCDGVHTKYWWQCVGPLVPGTVGPNVITSSWFAMRVDSSGPYSVTTSNQVSGGTQGLNTTEQSNAFTQTQVAPVLPAVPVAIQ